MYAPVGELTQTTIRAKMVRRFAQRIYYRRAQTSAVKAKHLPDINKSGDGGERMRPSSSALNHVSLPSSYSRLLSSHCDKGPTIGPCVANFDFHRPAHSGMFFACLVVDRFWAFSSHSKPRRRFCPFSTAADPAEASKRTIVRFGHP